MHCTKCGTVLEFAGQGHTCRSLLPETIRVPVGWSVVTWLLAGFTVFYAVCGVATAALDLPPAGTPVTIWFLLLAVGVLFGSLLALIGTIVLLIMWNRRTQQLADRFGFDAGLVVKGWVVRAFVLTLIVAMCLESAGSQWTVGVWAMTGVRVAAGLLLLGNVVVGRHRVLTLIGDANRQVSEARG
ncbi:hypothetical protein [Actinoplanes sp. NPDC089786]|uniref:hypothetical protein n=1 Tax=Actinoplanes sp. NPDC089786 TaxID=3155185 RepID=UPI003426AEBC